MDDQDIVNLNVVLENIEYLLDTIEQKLDEHINAEE